MSKYISLYSFKGYSEGFFIDGLRIINNDGSILKYRKNFNDSNKTMEEKLKLEIEYLNFVKQHCKCLL